MQKPADKTAEPLPAPGRLTALPVWQRWVLLVPASAVITVGLELVHMPAALLLGAMIAAILFGINGARLTVAPVPFVGAQAVIACLVAKAINPGIVATFAEGWPIFLTVVLATIAASSLIGYAMARAGSLPSTTAVWGTSAGAATAMVVLAEENGADQRLVAFMQYSRVVAVTIAASVIAAYVFSARGGATTAVDWFAPVDWPSLAIMLAVAFASATLGGLTPIPGGSLLLPTVLLSALHAAGWLEIELPEWLLAASYALIGWRVGLGFTRRILYHAARALPQILASITLLIAFCGGLAWVLTRAFGIDGLTAYLATSPGGLDTVAIIAASTPVDVSFIMALQAVRMILIMLAGPWISQKIARLVARQNAAG